ncbi:MAG: SusC/RagA family TonB-linked outer membrane protein [Ignavibacteria bacterium]|nr:SusC/RagA family TonB-linked outer membrane protein [Ignavibacteria bacterium]
MRKTILFMSLFIILSNFLLAQTTYKVSGKVTDSKTGAPLIGANVILKPTAFGAATDVNGMFSIDVPRSRAGESMVLEVSYLGYQKASFPFELAGNLLQNVELKEDVLNLQTVVVTGMGAAIEKQKLGVTIGNVSSDAVVNSKALDVISAIQGKVANVEVTSASGEPGASTYIRIRGAHSITGGTQPLIVVDGSPVNNQEIGISVGGVTQMNRASDINPKDIESIDILKGAAAAALYGSRAQNGVVLITTKSGKPGKPKVSYDVSYSFDEITSVQPLQQKFGQGSGGVASTTSPFSWGPELAPGTPTYNHERNMFQTGNILDNNFTISGGNEWTTYYLSAGRTDQKGTIVGKSSYDRNSVRVKASQRISEKINVTGNIQFVDVSSERIQKGSNVSGLLLAAWRTPPSFDNSLYLDPTNGFHRSYRLQSPTTLKVGRGYDNPYFIVYEHVNDSEVGRTFGNIRVDFDPFDWLNISYTLGHDYTNDERRTVLPPSSSGAPTGQVTREKFSTQETDGNLVITVEQKFDFADMNATLLLGQNMNQRKYDAFSTTGNDMAVYGFNQLDNTASYTPDEFSSIVRSESFFGQLTLELYNQLFLTAALRNDGSSTFGKSQKRHWYPKVSAAWEFTKLDLFTEISDVLNFAKLRLAYGEAGQEPGVYTTITAFGSSTSAFGDGWGASFTSSAYGFGGFYTSGGKGQDKIKPQRSKEFELGLDLGLLDEKIGIEFTYYNSKTTDAIFSLPLAPSTGYTSQVQNAGTINNKGYELSITAQPINITNFKWDLGLIYAKNKNEVESLPGAEFISLGGFTSAHGSANQGYPLPMIRGYDYVRFGLGIVYNNVDIDKTYTGWKPGELYIHTTGYPVQDPQIRLIGNPNPDWTGSVRSTFTLFGEIEISALIDIKQGGDVWNGTKGAIMYFGTSQATADRGTKVIFEGKGPGAGKEVVKDQAYYTGVGSSFVGPSSANMEDGSYVKLREIAIAYTLRNEFIKDLVGISSIDFRLSARNLKTWTDYTGIDPETNLTGGTNLRGLDYFNNPQVRNIILSLRFNY